MIVHDLKHCRITLIHVETRQPLPDDDPKMVIVNKLWDQQTMATKIAYHNVCCCNSRDPLDLGLWGQFLMLVAEAFSQEENTN